MKNNLFEMKLNSLARKTDFIFAKFSGEVIMRDHYILVRTPSNPGYHWGNYLIFDQAPKQGDLERWKSLFDRELEYLQDQHHYLFTWDTGKTEFGDIQEFKEAGFEFDTAFVLSTKKLIPPTHFNPNIQVKKIETDSQWEEVIKLQVLCADQKYAGEGYEGFKRRQFAEYKKMVSAKAGAWFGAYLNSILVADLGVFCESGLGRYQYVETHPNYRNQGICGSLVYLAGLEAQKHFGASTLVMEADANYHAARIYEKIGFEKCETNYSLSWWQK